MRKEHRLIGTIISKKHVPIYQGRLKGQSYYDLIVDITRKTKPAIFGGTIQAIHEKILNDNLWDEILTDNYFNKKYLFICHKDGHCYKLIRAKEIISKNQGQSLEKGINKTND